MPQDPVDIHKAHKHQSTQTFRTKTLTSWVPISTEFRKVTDHLQETTWTLLDPQTIMPNKTMLHNLTICQTFKTKIKITTTRTSNKTLILIKLTAITHSNKCNNSRLSNVERISSKERDSWIIKLITPWIIKIKLTIKRMEHHRHQMTQLIGMDRQSKKTSLSKKCKTQALCPQAEAKSSLL